MTKQDWDKAPADAQFYSFGRFVKHVDGNEFYWDEESWYATTPESMAFHEGWCDFEMRPSTSERSHPAAACQYNENLAPPMEWPVSDVRIDIIGQNGGEGEHYAKQQMAEQCWTATMKQLAVSATLDEREQTYGDFSVLAHSVEQMESFIKSLPGYSKATPGHREAAHMIIQKLVRALNGDPHYKDSWHDIAGYAKLAEKECKQ